MKTQISNSTVIDKSYPNRHDLRSDGSEVLQSNVIKLNTLVFVGGELLIEGIENDYLIKDGEIEFMTPPLNNTIISLLTF